MLTLACCNPTKCQCFLLNSTNILQFSCIASFLFLLLFPLQQGSLLKACFVSILIDLLLLFFNFFFLLFFSPCISVFQVAFIPKLIAYLSEIGISAFPLGSVTLIHVTSYVCVLPSPPHWGTPESKPTRHLHYSCHGKLFSVCSSLPLCPQNCFSALLRLSVGLIFPLSLDLAAHVPEVHKLVFQNRLLPSWVHFGFS